MELQSIGYAAAEEIKSLCSRFFAFTGLFTGGFVFGLSFCGTPDRM